MTRCSGERGAIVIEALIATLIIAAMAAAVLETVAARAAATRAMALRREAVLVAESRLAEVTPRAAALPETTEGRDGALAWRVDAAPFHADEASRAGVLALVTVRVSDRTSSGQPAALLRTLRFAR